MKKIVVLGCGMVGRLIVRDLSTEPDFDLSAVDASEPALASVSSIARVRTVRADLSDRASVARAVSDADVVVGAVPGRLGGMVLECVIESGKSICDISFSPGDPLALTDRARERGTVAIVDCGVSPGLSNLAVGRASAKLAHIDYATIYVGGLPTARHWPFEYRSVFSPTDVIEEYTRPARLIEGGRVVVRPALSSVELVDIPGVGTLEAFDTDGLRTLLTTVRADTMREKTLRYPGHADRMRMLRETGFFAETPIDCGGGVSVAPRQLTERLLFDAWRRPPGEEELTALRVSVQGRDAAGAAMTLEYDLLDRTDRATGESSMARTTGFPCAIVTRMLARGVLEGAGVIPPEHLGRDARVYEHIVTELARRGVAFREREVPAASRSRN